MDQRVFLYKVSIQPALAHYFWPQESRHFVSILRYLIQFLSLCSFVDRVYCLGFGLVVGLGSVLVLFFLAFFSFLM